MEQYNTSVNFKYNNDTDDVLITVPVIKFDETEIYAKIDYFRPSASFLHPELFEWIKDTGFLLKELLISPFDEEVCLNALSKICKKHISEFSKLVDVELFTYIDEILIIVKQFNGFFLSDFIQNHPQTFWITLRNLAYDEFEEYIWIKTPPENPLNFKLVKLRDSY